jgi:FkbM family methyltransferase
MGDLISAGWVGFRLARRYWFSLRGRNPVVRDRHAPRLSEDWSSVQGVRRARIKVEKLRDDGEGRSLWRTSLGELWVATTAPADHVGMLAAEMESGVYPLAPNDQIVLDCGANAGFFSRYAVAHGARQVIAFEPSPINVACLSANMSAEIAAGAFVLIEKGVWDSTTTLSFNSENAENPGSHHITQSGGNLRISVTTIDEVIDELHPTRLDYIKMDIEGAETRALSGATRTIRRFRPRLCVAVEHTDDIFANALDVIEAVRQIDDSYDYVCTESHPCESPSQGEVLAPYTILFCPDPFE